MYADIHLHLYEARDPRRVVEESRKGGIYFLLTAGEDLETSRRCLELTALEGVYGAVGVHPSRAGASFDVKSVEELLSHPRVVAIGEVGMDAKYVRWGVPLERQRSVFLGMVNLAREYDLPLSVHSGRSFKEVLDILFRSDVRAHLHWYSGSVDLALEAAESGMLFSFGPAILHYPSYRGLVEVLPLESIATETDYPVRVGGRENHPLRVREVAERIAEIKGLKVERVVKTIYNNALSFFGVRA